MNLDDEFDDILDIITNFYHKVSDDCPAKQDLRTAIYRLTEIDTLYGDD